MPSTVQGHATRRRLQLSVHRVYLDASVGEFGLKT